MYCVGTCEAKHWIFLKEILEKNYRLENVQFCKTDDKIREIYTSTAVDRYVHAAIWEFCKGFVAGFDSAKN